MSLCLGKNTVRSLCFMNKDREGEEEEKEQLEEEGEEEEEES